MQAQRVWDVYDERLQFMSREDAFNLDEALLKKWWKVLQLLVDWFGSSLLRKKSLF